MSKFSRYFLGVLFQIMSFLTHRAMYLSLTLVTSYHNYCDIFSSSFQKYNLHSYLCRTVLQMSLHSPLSIESNTFSFLSLSWPVLLYLSPQFPSCLRVTAASYVLVSPKSAVIATEKSHLKLALAVSSAQHCPSLVPPISLWLHSKLDQEDELGYKNDTAFTAPRELDLTLCCWWHLKKTTGLSVVPQWQQPKSPAEPHCVLSV